MASEDINPLDNPEAWDKLEVGGVESPGLALVGEFKRAHDWDVKKGKGADGATLTFNGRPPAEGSVEFQLWTRAHFTEWSEWLQLLKYDPIKKAPQPIDAWHPSLADLDINSLVTQKIGNIVHKGNQLYSVTVDFIEYLPPPKASATSTPNGSVTTPPGTTPGTPTDPVADAQQAEIAALLKKAGEP